MYARCYRRRRKIRGKIRQDRTITIAFRTPDGRSGRLAGFTDKGVAQDFARKLDQLIGASAAGAAPDGEVTRWIQRLDDKVRETLADAGVLDAARAAGARKLDDQVDNFEAALLAKGGTTHHAARTARRVRAVAKGCGFNSWQDIRASSVLTFLARKREAGMSIETSNHYLQSFKHFCKWMVSERRAVENPVAHLSRMNARVDRRIVRRALSPDEQRRLIAVAQFSKSVYYGMAGRDRAMLYRLTLETGLRWGESRSLTPSSFDLDCHRPTVQVLAAYSKHRRDDTLALRPEAAEALRPYLKRREGKAFPMPRSDQGAKILRADLWEARKAWWREVRGAREKLRRRIRSDFLSSLDAQGRRVDFHALRHTFVSNLSAARVHPKTTQALARHSTITLTMDRYTHLDSAGHWEALDALPDLDAPAAPREAEALRMTGTDDVPTMDQKWTFSGSQKGTSCHSVARSGNDSNARSREMKSPENTEECCVSGPSKTGGPSRTRTCDQGIMSPLL